MRALSVRQPFANLIASGRKTIELRPWSTDYRGPLVICAGRTVEREAATRLRLGWRNNFPKRIMGSCGRADDKWYTPTSPRGGRMFPGRHFTPDGHMFGSLGEALAAFHYGVELDTASAQCHDGRCGNRNVQVKATQTKRIAISSEPEHLLVLVLLRDGTFKEIYNGPGELVWNLVAHKPLPKNGQYQVPLSKLSALMGEVPDAQKLPLVQA